MGGASVANDVQVALPMCLFCQIVPPQQTAAYKLTLDTNRPPPQLADLFQDMVAQAQAGHCLIACKQLPLFLAAAWSFVQMCTPPADSALCLLALRAACGYATLPG